MLGASKHIHDQMLRHMKIKNTLYLYMSMFYTVYIISMFYVCFMFYIKHTYIICQCFALYQCLGNCIFICSIHILYILILTEITNNAFQILSSTFQAFIIDSKTMVKLPCWTQLLLQNIKPFRSPIIQKFTIYTPVAFQK